MPWSALQSTQNEFLLDKDFLPNKIYFVIIFFSGKLFVSWKNLQKTPETLDFMNKQTLI